MHVLVKSKRRDQLNLDDVITSDWRIDPEVAQIDRGQAHFRSRHRPMTEAVAAPAIIRVFRGTSLRLLNRGLLRGAAGTPAPAPSFHTLLRRRRATGQPTATAD